MSPIAPANIIFELICFAAFAAVCGGLLKPRFSVKISLLITAGCLVVIAGIQTAVFWRRTVRFSWFLRCFRQRHTAGDPRRSCAVKERVCHRRGDMVVRSADALYPEPARDLLCEQPVITLDWLWLPCCVHWFWPYFWCSRPRFCRKPFQRFVFHNKYIWIIVPVILALSLASYVENINFTPILAGILF